MFLHLILSSAQNSHHSTHVGNIDGTVDVCVHSCVHNHAGGKSFNVNSPLMPVVEKREKRVKYTLVRLTFKGPGP